MGQYYQKSKIGTCESMYYLRLEEAQELAAQGKHDDDGISFESYINDNTTRFRFPFPDEDESRNYDKHDKGYNLPAGGIEINHETITVSSEHHGKGHNMNIWLPCPYSQEFKNLGLKTSNNGAGEQFLTVRFQAIRNGKEKTIFSCARCDQQQWMTDDDVEKLKARCMEYFEPYNRQGKSEHYDGNQGYYDYAMKVLERVK